MTYGEAYRLTVILSADPATALAAAVNEWDAPRSREWFLLADNFDLMAKGFGFKRPKPYPRPGTGPRKRGRTNMTRAQVVAVLNQHGHDL